MFGSHLTLDLYSCDSETLGSSEKIFQLLNELPAVINMHKFSEPQISIIPEQPNSFDKGGITAFVILVESHIAIHTFLNEGFVTIDVFSCKYFKEDRVVKHLTEFFGAKNCEKNKFERGRSFVKHYPRNVRKAAEIAAVERSTNGRTLSTTSS